MRLVLNLFSKLVLGLLKLRYKIELKNSALLKECAKERKGGILFLPNHPAEVDPLLITSLLFPKFRPRPLAVDHFYYLSGASFFMKLVNALPIPNFETAINTWKQKRGEKAISEIQQGLKRGDNFLIYPSGHLRRSPKERIGGSSLVHTLLSESPDIDVVLVRFSGLWGSMFSRAITGKAPNFWKALSQSIKVILKNGIFFVPKRQVTIEFFRPGDELPKKATKLEFNRYLERWYNQFDGGEEEPLKLVSYSRFKEEVPEVTFVQRSEREDLPKVSPKVRRELLDKLAEIAKVDPETIEEKMDLSMDLGLDSLDIAAMLAFIDHKYGADGNHPGDLQTVNDLFYAAMGVQLGDEEEVTLDPHLHWKNERERPEVTLPMGATIPESFLRMCDRMGSHEACYDTRIGVSTYKRLKKSALVLADFIRGLPGERIGILLPSSTAAYLLIHAILLAKKVPVMLNWTTGPRALNHAVALTQLETILSSRTFLERSDGVDFGDIDDKLLLMEDAKKNLTLKNKLKGLFRSFLSPDLVIRLDRLREISPHNPAVMLFTSGTESFPKAVPLSHFNILSNQRAALSCIDLNRKDVMIGALPPFHSFGFSVTGLLPLLAGFRIVYWPDPTDSAMMVSLINKWGVTVCCLAPSFYKNVFNVGTPEDFKTIRYFVSGAEKAPQELFDIVAQMGPGKQVVEGYGITECSPVVTISRPTQPIVGVGQPLPGIDVCTISTETGEPLPQGTPGEICFKGPSIFGGYYGKDVPRPFVEIDGENWYRSGDMGYLDANNNLIYQGRLKRFVKIGGEMVSLTALEEELMQFARNRGVYDPERDRCPLAISAIERENDRPELVLITTFDVSKEEVNHYLHESGFARIAKISRTQQVDVIPLTGTGKIHFKALNDLASKVAHV